MISAIQSTVRKFITLTVVLTFGIELFNCVSFTLQNVFTFLVSCKVTKGLLIFIPESR